MFHDVVEVAQEFTAYDAQAGDCVVELDQPQARYAVETLEPQAHDSFFRWGFFNSVLERKERYSDYVFEDTALEMLQAEPELKASFEQWKVAHPELLADQSAVLDFIFSSGQRHRLRLRAAGVNPQGPSRTPDWRAPSFHPRGRFRNRRATRPCRWGARHSTRPRRRG
jgi:hypothetical protein